MRLGEFLTDLGRPAAYYPSLMRACGGVQAGLVLCQLAYWHGKQRDPDGWIRKSAAEMEEETGLTTREQQTGRSRLRRRGVLVERLRGIPATVEYRLQLEVLDALWASFSLANPLNQFGESAKLVSPNRQTISETTAETTSEKKLSPLAALASTREDGSAGDQQQDLTTASRLSADATSKRQAQKQWARFELDAFEVFWDRFPRKVAKPEAMKAWQQTVTARPAIDVLMRCLLAQMRSE